MPFDKIPYSFYNKSITMKSRLYFSEPGIACSAGMTCDDLWKSVRTGNRSGMKKVVTCTGKEIQAARIEESSLVPSRARYDMKVVRIEEAALNVLEDAVNRAVARYGKKRVAVSVGSCDNGSEFSVAGHRAFFSRGIFPSGYALEMQGADYVASYVKERFGLEGPACTVATACSSSAVAIIKAAELIEADIADACIVGGVDIASDTVLLGFDSLEAVSPEPTNPFSRNRNGITLGDGAAFFVLSRDYDGKGAPVFLAGCGESADASHMTAPGADGRGAADAMKEALADSGLRPSDIDYVNLHGTGTKLNDAMESKAMAEVFGGDIPWCSSTKSVTGHTLGAAGALEAAICVETLRRNEGREWSLPMQVWDGQRDESLPELKITGPENVMGTGDMKYCMTNSYAFGGSNVSLVIGKEARRG